MHVKVGRHLYLRSEIVSVDCTDLETWYRVKVRTSDDALIILEGQEALDLVMDLRPGMIEGKRFRFARQSWAFHNLVAHPALQVLAWLGQHRLGFWIHDKSVPKPRRIEL